MKDYKFYNLIVTITVLLGSSPLIFYFYKFANWQFKLSNKTEDWANFGEFIGGTINTLISLASLIALFKITIYANELNKKLNENQNQNQVYVLKKQLEINIGMKLLKSFYSVGMLSHFEKQKPVQYNELINALASFKTHHDTYYISLEKRKDSTLYDKISDGIEIILKSNQEDNTRAQHVKDFADVYKSVKAEILSDLKSAFI